MTLALLATAIGASLAGFPVWVYIAVWAIGFIGIFGWIYYWNRAHVFPLIRAAKESGHPAPWIELDWPRWMRLGAKAYVTLLASSLVLLLVLLVVATVAKKL